MSQKSKSKFNAAILIASDRSFAGTRDDVTGPMLEARLRELNYDVAETKIVPDVKDAVTSALKKWVDEDKINLIITSGGTGVAPRDVTPEATLEVIEKRVPGMEEVMRRESLAVTPNAMLSRAVVGVAGESLIINLPGNPKGALENFKALEQALDHALKLITGETPDP